MRKLERNLQTVDMALSWFVRVVIGAAAIFIGYVAFQIFGVMDLGTLIRWGGSALVALIAYPVIWLVLKIVSAF